MAQVAAPVEVPGLLKMEVWNGLSTTDNSLDNTLLADPRYPTTPDATFYTTGFSSRTVYPDDTHDGYGGRISGYIIPQTTGDYRFFLYSDDSSRLFLSPDDKSANAVQIAEETGCCNIFTEPDLGTTRTSEPVTMTAGKKYYIEGIWKEGGGGDYMFVAWRKEGDTTPAASLQPISPAFVAVTTPANGSVVIKTPPANATAAQNDFVNFTVEVTTTNSPVLIQWQRNGVTLPGKTGGTLTLGPLPASDNAAKFRAVVSTPGAVATSAEATLTVTADVTAPTITAVFGSDTFNSVTVDFSEAVTAASAGASSNYKLDGGLTVSAVTVLTPTRVRLTTSKQAQGATYTLSAAEVTDTAGLKLAANTTKTFTSFAPIRGGLRFAAYLNYRGTLAELPNEPRYPNEPDIAAYTTSFTSRTVFTDTSNENYAGRISGWIVPSETASFEFFIRSDDAGQLYLSTDDSEANIQLIAEETGCCGPFEEPGAPETSLPQTLTAGKRYFIMALWKEGGGGDYCDVAWRKVGDPAVARALPYIQGSVLESLAAPTTFTPPTVAIVDPVAGTTIAPGKPVVINASAIAAAAKSITRIEFFASTKKVGEATSSPWSLTLLNLAEDVYTLVARATDSAGITIDSAPVQITVGPEAVRRVFAAIDANTEWRYDRSGQDLGTAWRDASFNDSAWPKGKALIADESTTTVEPIRTAISRFNDAGEYVKTFYFRLKFNYSDVLSPEVKLKLRHVVDDGAVFYLNGTEIHRFGIAAGVAVDATTDASGHENTYEGPYDIPTSLLKAGENILACEVHQSGGSSSDMVFGAELIATVPTIVKSLLAINDVTEWRYDRSGQDLGSTWRERSFNDSAWPKGKALIADESTTTVEPIRTAISRFNDANEYVKTFYFRSLFNLPELGNSKVSLKLRHVVDDGAVFYLNGTEVHRFGIAAGVVVDATTDAAGHENAYEGPFELPQKLLLPGDNILAVEVHQSGGSSSDMVFGAELSATIQPEGAGTEVGGDLKFETPTLKDGKVNIVWAGSAKLLSAPTPSGPWTPVPTAASPYQIPPSEPAAFYRLTTP